MKKFFNKIKRSLAIALSVAMLAGGMSAMIPTTAKAAELQNNTNLMNGRFQAGMVNGHAHANNNHGGASTFGHGENTAYEHGYIDFGRTTYNSNIHTTFNFAALPKDRIHYDNVSAIGDEGYRKGDALTLTTVYDKAYWKTAYQFGKLRNPIKPYPGPTSSDAVIVDPDITLNSTNHVSTDGANPPTQDEKLYGDTSPGLKNGEVTTLTDANGEVEVRQEILPSSTGEFLIVQYTVHNTKSQAVNFSIGNVADTMINNHDGCPTIVTPQTGKGDKFEGLHIIANNGGTYRFTNLDILTYHPDSSINAGMQRRDGNDPSETRVWAEYWRNTPYTTSPGSDGYGPGPQLNFSRYIFAKSPEKFTNDGVDAAAAFSANFNLMPHETKIARFAVSMKVGVYYVDPLTNNTTQDGFIATPCKSIKQAMDEIAARGASLEKAFIYVMNDAEIDQTITVPSGKSITLETTDFTIPTTGDWAGGNVPEVTAEAPKVYTGGNKTIKRAAGFNEEMFKVDAANTTLVINDVNIDGGSSATSTAPMIKATAGIIRTLKGSKLVNNYINANGSNNDVASAIDIGGSAQLELNNVEITGNKAINGAAIVYDGLATTSPASNTPAKGFLIKGNLQISGNADSSSGRANVMLGNGKFMQTLDDIGASNIGVSSKTPITATGQEVVVAQKGVSLGDSTVIHYASSNFVADKQGTNVSISTTPPNEGKAVLTASISTIYAGYVNAANGTPISGHPGIHSQYSAGTSLAGKPEASSKTIPGWVIDGVEFNNSDVALSNIVGTNKQATVGGLTFTMPVSPDGTSVLNVTGSMPTSDIFINYKYIRNRVVHKFDAQGGTAISEKDEAVNPSATASIYPLPTAETAKVGYTLSAWHRYDDTDGNGKFDTGETDHGVVTALMPPTSAAVYNYYAVWTPGGSGYAVTEEHKNKTASTPVTFKTSNTQHLAGDNVTASPLTIPGYKRDSNVTVPAGIGAFDASGNFAFTMNTSPFSIKYVYDVDPAVKCNFKVRHEWTNGTLISENTVQKIAEQPIVAAPLSDADKAYASHSILAGQTGTVPANGPPYLTGTDDFGGAFDLTTHIFTSLMPNQDVTILYRYNSTTATLLNRKYLDADNGDAIIKVDSEPKNHLDPINLPAPSLYGYIYMAGSATVDPSTTAGLNAAAGTFNGTMPNSNLTLTYKMNRDIGSGLWQNMNFAVAAAPYDKGTLTGASSLQFLIDDGLGSATDPHGHTLENIKSMYSNFPTAKGNPERYYMFEAWYTDPNCTPTSKVDPGATKFSGAVTLYAKFVEDPAHWIDINFSAGPNGSISGPSTLHTYDENKWGDIASYIPSTVPIVNYIDDGWTVNGTAVVNSTPLVNGATYIANFKKDPLVWGTNPGPVPNSYFSPVGQIGFDGSGQIKINAATPGYKYIIVDEDGKVVAVVTANSPTETVQDLYPGATYQVYEATPDAAVNVGDNTNTMPSPPTFGASNTSAANEVMTPTVDGNYSVANDPANDERASLIINPADPDSDYALIDQDGNVVRRSGADADGWMTPQGSAPSTVTWDDLDPNTTYRVVARKKGDTATTPNSRVPWGNDIVTNVGDLAESQKFRVVTKNGEIVSVGTTAVGSSEYIEAGATDTVTIHADSTNASGKNFLYWKVIAGRSTDFTSRVNTPDHSFNLSSSNIVLQAVYERELSSPLNAIVEDERRGTAAEGEFALDPDQISALEETLTTAADEVLMGINNAEVTYKVVFDKKSTKAADKALVRPLTRAAAYPKAFTAAYTLDVYADRYVDGRKVERASTSNAAVKVITQLPKVNMDQMDYDIVEIDPMGNPTLLPALTPDPDKDLTAGYLVFDGKLNHRYVLVYSKAFWLRFYNSSTMKKCAPFTPEEFFGKTKARKGESAASTAYEPSPAANALYQNKIGFSRIDAYNSDVTTLGSVGDNNHFEDKFGVDYQWKHWAEKCNTANKKKHELDKEVKRHMILCGHYEDNRSKVASARTELTDLIAEGHVLKQDPFIKAADIALLDQLLAESQNVLDADWLNPGLNLRNTTMPIHERMANEAELRAQIDALRALIMRLRDEITRNRNAYLGRTGGSSGGGRGSAGRGTGSSRRPLEGTVEKTFMMGINGNWEKDPDTGKYKYILHGGLPLVNNWGKIQTFDAARSKMVTHWYFFDNEGIMVTGWYLDSRTNIWYHLNTEKGAKEGQMTIDFFTDTDGHMYYLDPVTGAMQVGWRKIGESWYYFSTSSTAQRPYGSLYRNTTTPDGYKVGGSGAWIE